MKNIGPTLFLGLILFIAFLAGKLLVYIVILAAIGLMGRVLRKMTQGKKDIKVAISPQPVKIGPLEIVPVRLPQDYRSLVKEVENALGTVHDSPRVLNERFILVTGLWDLQTPLPPYLHDAIGRKICYELTKLLSVPDIDKQGVHLTNGQIFRKLADEELQEFYRYCLANR